MPDKIDYICDLQLLPEVNEVVCSRQFMVEEYLELPCIKPDIESLVDVKVWAEIKSYKFINSLRGKKVFIRGSLKQEILYTADTPCQPVHAFHFDSSFSTYMDLSCTCISNYSALEMHSPKILVEFMEATKVCSRSISKSAILLVWYPTSLIIPPKPQPIYINCPQPSCQIIYKPRRRVYKYRHYLEE